MILAGDIGGTKTNLALFEKNGDILDKIFQKQFPSKEYNDFGDIINEFKGLAKEHSITSACFGIAGPVIEEECITTNLPWNIKTKKLKNTLLTKKVQILNDLEATAYGMLYISEEKFVSLNPKAKKSKGNIAVIAAGTGLGEAQLFFDGTNYHPIGCEGGHTDFAPLDDRQDKLLKWLRARFPEHVSYERILSGSGIYTLYEFLKESGFADECESMKNIDKTTDKSAMVSKCALEENDPLSRETINLFCKIYGAEAGNLALKAMSLGGVYIGGGIAPKILPIIKNGLFIENFIEKGRFRSLMESMEIKISLDQETALLGAAYFARDRLI